MKHIALLKIIIFVLVTVFYLKITVADYDGFLLFITLGYIFLTGSLIWSGAVAETIHRLDAEFQSQERPKSMVWPAPPIIVRSLGWILFLSPLFTMWLISNL